MSYSKEYDLIFVHVPKCAGTSVINTLGFDCHGHHSARSNEFVLKKRGHPTAISFAIVRNPFDRAVSVYEYLRMDKSYWHAEDGSAPYGMTDLHVRAKKMSFIDFLRLVSSFRCTMTKNHHLHPQHWYTHSEEGELRVDHLIRMEDGISESISTLIGKEVTLPRINSSGREKRDWKSYYAGENGNEAASLVLKIYREDFRKFEYTPRVPDPIGRSRADPDVFCRANS